MPCYTFSGVEFALFSQSVNPASSILCWCLLTYMVVYVIIIIIISNFFAGTHIRT